jgi:hypothetical protein
VEAAEVLGSLGCPQAFYLHDLGNRNRFSPSCVTGRHFQRSKAMTRNRQRQLLSVVCALTLLVLTEKPLSAGGVDPTLIVKENGMDIGVLAFVAFNNGQTDAALGGRFQVTLKDPKTDKPYTLDALAKKLGEDHFNWLQDFKVNANLTVNSLADPNKPDGKIVTRTYKEGQTIIDPQSGGQAFGDSKKGQWSDANPWYYDETAIPKDLQNGNTVKSDGGIVWSADPNMQLSSQAKDNVLAYFDGAKGADITLSFTTFLVSVGPGNTYKPLAGFTWKEVFDKDGKGTITIDTENKGANLKPATFTKEINDEINDQRFGKWTPAKGVLSPEPSTLILLASGLFVTFPFRLRRRRQRQRLAARTGP